MQDTSHFFWGKGGGGGVKAILLCLVGVLVGDGGLRLHHLGKWGPGFESAPPSAYTMQALDQPMRLPQPAPPPWCFYAEARGQGDRLHGSAHNVQLLAISV